MECKNEDLQEPRETEYEALDIVIAFFLWLCLQTCGNGLLIFVCKMIRKNQYMTIIDQLQSQAYAGFLAYNIFSVSIALAR